MLAMQVRIRANYDALYDQAGIMVRLDERNWIKAGIEKSDGQCQLSSVLTVDRSDWATGIYGSDPANCWMRAT
jgi:regulation of enolase protein 1 (concanavalin A-like superfamily)